MFSHYYMPAEWAPHAATWCAWPYDDSFWRGQLNAVRDELAIFFAAIAEVEPINLLVHDAVIEADARSRLQSINAPLDSITFHRLPYNDIWLRDSGPTFVQSATHLKSINWRFNAWGEKFPWDLDNEIAPQIIELAGADREDVDVVMEGGSLEVNGSGTLLTTRQCLLSPMRNPNLGEAELTTVLMKALGVTQVIWLDEGLEGDHTDGHIDTITRFVDAQTIVTSTCTDTTDANFEPMQANLNQLRSARDDQGQPFRIIELPLPQIRRDFDGDRVAMSYANFYIANGRVIVPLYDDPNDEKAIQILSDCFPDRQVIGLLSKALVTGGGSFHCITQQQPAPV
jgi:agmatine deiminase